MKASYIDTAAGTFRYECKTTLGEGSPAFLRASTQLAPPLGGAPLPLALQACLRYTT